jgi:hypothetical protein
MNANFTYLWQEENDTRNRHIKPSSGKALDNARKKDPTSS